MRYGQCAEWKRAEKDYRWNGGTYYGGLASEEIRSVHSDGVRVAVGGWTYSWDGIASVGAWQETMRGGKEGFVAVFDGQGRRQWATYIGSGGDDEVMGVRVEGGSVYVAGTTMNGEWIGGGFRGGGQDGFVMRFDLESGRRQWGVGEDEVRGMDVGAGTAYVVGEHAECRNGSGEWRISTAGSGVGECGLCAAGEGKWGARRGNLLREWVGDDANKWSKGARGGGDNWWNDDGD